MDATKCRWRYIKALLEHILLTNKHKKHVDTHLHRYNKTVALNEPMVSLQAAELMAAHVVMSLVAMATVAQRHHQHSSLTPASSLSPHNETCQSPRINICCSINVCRCCYSYYHIWYFQVYHATQCSRGICDSPVSVSLSQVSIV